MLRLRSESDLAALGLSLDPSDKNKAVTQSSVHPPDIGNTTDLITLARARREGLRSTIKARKEAEGYETGAWWDYGEVLHWLRQKAKRKGEWGKVLVKIGEIKKKRQPDGVMKPEPNYNRAEEAITIFTQFASRVDAAKVRVRQAITRGGQHEAYGPYEDCFATPDWLWQVIKDEYNPTLDMFATDDWHLCNNYFTPETDAFQQDWMQHCPNKVGFMNCPYNFSVLGQAVVMAYEESQRGMTVVCVLPYYKSYDWFVRIVIPYGEIRPIMGRVFFQGFGPKLGKCSNAHDIIVVVFRPNQLGFTGEYVRREGDSAIDTFSGVERIKPPTIELPKPPALVLPEAKPPNKSAATDTVSTVVIGNSADLIAAVARLYFWPGMVIADPTYGRAVFWRDVDVVILPEHNNPGKLNLFPSDLYTGAEGTDVAKYDCRRLPYKDETFDAIVFDPPFGSQPYYQKEYQTETTDLTPDEVLRLYKEGIAEATRVLRPGGLLIVKCQDTFKGGRQRRHTITVWGYARRLGLIDVDRFVLIAAKNHQMNQGKQRHARKGESYLWIFRKPKCKPTAKPETPSSKST